MGWVEQLFRYVLAVIGLGLIIIGTLVYNSNWILTAIGGSIVFISGVRMHFLFYHKDRDPDEIAEKLKDTVKRRK